VATTQPPVILVDSVYSGVRQYPTAVFSASSSATGTDVRNLSSGRRERAWWQSASASANSGVTSDLGVGANKVVDSLWLDRGHQNCWGNTLQLNVRNDAGAVIDSRTWTVPASGTVGGDPTSGTLAVTEEGALYAFFVATAAGRYFDVFIQQAVQPLFTGLLLGQRTQIPYFSSTLDEDAGKIAGVVREQSDAGYEAVSRGYDHREFSLTYAKIGTTVYDGTLRQLRELLFARQQIAFVASNYGLYPARGWLMRHNGDTWSAPTTGVLRQVQIPLREVGALIK